LTASGFGCKGFWGRIPILLRSTRRDGQGPGNFGKNPKSRQKPQVQAKPQVQDSDPNNPPQQPGLTRLGCATRGNRQGWPPHTGVPEIGVHPCRLPREFVGVQRVMKTNANANANANPKAKAKRITKTQRLPALAFFRHQRLATWLALAADDFWYPSMRRPPKTAAARVKTQAQQVIHKTNKDEFQKKDFQ